MGAAVVNFIKKPEQTISSIKDFEIVKMKNKKIWLYGCPEDLRSDLTQVFPDYEINFPSVRRSMLDELGRIHDDGRNTLALWKDAKPTNLEEFLSKRNVPVVRMDIIDLHEDFREDQSSREIIGIRAIPINDLPEDKELVSMPNLENAGDETSSISELVQVASEYISAPTLCISKGNRPRACVAPSKDGLEKFFTTSGKNSECPLDTDEKLHSSYDFVLITPHNGNFFEYLKDQKLHAVVRHAFIDKWMNEFNLIITDEPDLARAAQDIGISVLDLNLKPWAVSDQDTEVRLKPSESPSGRDFSTKYLKGCHYTRRNVDYGRLSGLEEVLARFIQDIDYTAPEIEYLLPEDQSVDPKTIDVTRLTKDYQITFFDDRMKECELTCILPFRASVDRPDAITRVRNALLDESLPKNDICFLVVDDGSDSDSATQLRELCTELGFSYIYNDSQSKDFSVGRCRNIGAEYARSKFVFMQDIDLMPYDGFFRDLLQEIVVQEMHENAKHFLMIPYIFLTDWGTKVFSSLDPKVRRQKLIHAALTNDRALVEKFSTGTSANVYNRHWYLTRGGNSSDFEGWGYEDIEFNTRMIRHLKHFPLPDNWAVEKYNFNSVSEYSTYKSTYRLFGDMALMKGIALFHAWHPVVRESGYVTKAAINREIFIKKLKDFPKTGHEPDPLPDRSKGRTLLMRKNAFTVSRSAAPAFGEQFFLPDETALPNKVSFERFLKHYDITRVLFFNPFQTPHMRRIQGWVRELDVPFLVAERGSLPGSCFYDPNGFLFDSSTYDPENWNSALNRAERAAVQETISELRSSKPSLEDQPPAIGGSNLRKKLKISGDEAVIFVPLQRPDDTVTRFFTRNVSYADFVNQVVELSSRHIDGVRILVKNHPLEDRYRDWGNAVVVDNVNVYDLIEASDLVWTYNSGVGVLAMVWEKFCATSGAAFYSSPGINSNVENGDEVLEVLSKDPAFDRDTSLRFLHHLTNNVYSYGDLITKPVRMPNGSRMTATTDVRHSILRIEGYEHLFTSRSKPLCGRESVLFDRYRYAETSKSK